MNTAMHWLRWAALALAALALLVLAVGQLGLLQGRAPTDLGVHAGRLKPPSTTDNSVSSQALLWAGHPRQRAAQIAPLPLAGDAPQALARLRQVLAAMPGASVVEQRSDYLYVRFSTRWLKFVDDAEFWVDPVAGVIQLRSASRLGQSDLGVNRARIEQLRRRLATADGPGG